MKYILLLLMLTSCAGSKVIYAPNDPARYSGRVITTIERWNGKGDTVRKVHTQWRVRL